MAPLSFADEWRRMMGARDGEMARAGRRLIVTAVSVMGLIIVACTTGTGSPSAAPGSVSAPVSPSAGPTAVQVALQEWAVLPAAEVIDEVTVSLDPGKYVLLCTIYDESENVAHYKRGMRAVSAVS